jgi:hypothetical protein
MGKGLAAAGILVIVWIFLKDPLVKLISSIKEKYGKS